MPNSTDCTPLLANLFLFFYEYRYMKDMLKTDIHKARKFSNTMRYIDDLLSFNNTVFDQEIPNIYPPQLILKKTTETVDRLSYLQIQIDIINQKFMTTLYVKRDNFNFHIVNLPHMESNIPTKPDYGVYISQLVRIGKICEDFSSFASRYRLLTERQGYTHRMLCVGFKKFSHRHS